MCLPALFDVAHTPVSHLFLLFHVLPENLIDKLQLFQLLFINWTEMSHLKSNLRGLFPESYFSICRKQSEQRVKCLLSWRYKIHYIFLFILVVFGFYLPPPGWASGWAGSSSVHVVLATSSVHGSPNVPTHWLHAAKLNYFSSRKSFFSFFFFSLTTPVQIRLL